MARRILAAGSSALLVAPMSANPVAKAHFAAMAAVNQSQAASNAGAGQIARAVTPMTKRC